MGVSFYFVSSLLWRRFNCMYVCTYADEFDYIDHLYKHFYIGQYSWDSNCETGLDFSKPKHCLSIVSLVSIVSFVHYGIESFWGYNSNNLLRHVRRDTLYMMKNYQKVTNRKVVGVRHSKMAVLKSHVTYSWRILYIDVVK